MSKEEEYIIKTSLTQPVIISLPANPTTGFSWEIGSYDPALKCRKLPYHRHSGGGLGGGGVQEFEITIQQKGEFLVQFQLKRLWETKVREERTYRIVVADKR